MYSNQSEMSLSLVRKTKKKYDDEEIASTPTLTPSYNITNILSSS